MYNEFKNLFADGLSKSAIARKTGHDRKTVRKYISMSEQELEHHLERISQRTKKLQRYEEFVRNRISNCIDCSAAQVEDWLKEHHPDFQISYNEPLLKTKGFHILQPSLQFQ